MKISEKIEAFILSNLVPSSERKIGIEVESVFYNHDMKRLPVNKCEQFSAESFLREMQKLKQEEKIEGTFSLEPGGQLEWSSPPCKDLFSINDQFQTQMRRTKEICNQNNLLLVDYALEPLYSPEEIDLINMKKYRLMHSKFLHTGNHGPWMMRNTASVQINIDVTSKKDAEEMAFIADCLQPLSSILFSNSPFLKGKPAGKENLRYKIWNDTDSIRCNYLLDHTIESVEGLIKKYCEYVQKVPAIFVKDTNNSIQEYRETLGGWLAGLEKRNQIRDEHILTVLRQIFTHVRFKHVLEIRGCDRPPCGYEMAPVSFWAGLLCADVSRKSILAMLKNWTIEERKQLNNSAQYLDISRNGPQGKPIREWLEKVCTFALEGLGERQEKLQMKNEIFLLEEFIADFFKNGPKGIQTQKKFRESGQKIVDFIKSNCSKD